MSPQPLGTAEGRQQWPGTVHGAQANPGDNGRRQFEDAVQALESGIANAGTHAVLDAEARLLYARQIKAMSDELRQLASRGAISWFEAASQAQEARNLIMDMVRRRSTPVGRARAEAMKPQGKTLNSLVADKAAKLFGKGVDFNTLSKAQQDTVYAEVVASAGRGNEGVNAAMRRFSRAGRALLVLSLAISVYEIAVAEDKVQVAKREAVVTGSGIAGGMAGGALAGLACGPGAPVCVTIGAFVGGALAAFGAASFF
ncbi:hypothetical protein ACFX58_16675 [Sphingomonas sp. NCPPB 2930]